MDFVDRLLSRARAFEGADALACETALRDYFETRLELPVPAHGSFMSVRLGTMTAVNDAGVVIRAEFVPNPALDRHPLVLRALDTAQIGPVRVAVMPGVDLGVSKPDYEWLRDAGFALPGSVFRASRLSDCAYVEDPAAGARLPVTTDPDFDYTAGRIAGIRTIADMKAAFSFAHFDAGLQKRVFAPYERGQFDTAGAFWQAAGQACRAGVFTAAWMTGKGYIHDNFVDEHRAGLAGAAGQYRTQDGGYALRAVA